MTTENKNPDIQEYAILDGYFLNPIHYREFGYSNWAAKISGKNAAHHKRIFLDSKEWGVMFDVSKIEKGDVLQIAYTERSRKRSAYRHGYNIFVRVVKIKKYGLVVEKYETLSKALKAYHAARMVEKAKRAAAYQARKTAAKLASETSSEQ